MKKVVFAATIAAFAAAPAFAADMAVKAPPISSSVAPTWTGFYFGGNLGGAWAHTNWCTDATITSCFTAPFDVISESGSSVVGGGQIGYRWQSSNYVLGIEAMFDGLNINKLQSDPNVAAGRTRTTTFNDLASVTGQIGYAWANLLAYAKGGWAWTRISLDANNTNPGGLDLHATESVSGWTIAGGLEYLVSQHLSFGIEYGYYGFKPGNITNLTNSGGVLIGCAFCNFGTSTNVQTVTGRMNFKF